MHSDSAGRGTRPGAGHTAEQAQGSLGQACRPGRGPVPRRGTPRLHKQVWPHLSAAPVPPASVPTVLKKTVLQVSRSHAPAQVAPDPDAVPTSPLPIWVLSNL